MNLKNIHIVHMIKDRVGESDLEISHMCNFLKYTEEEIREMYQSKSLDKEILLRWSKLVRYDFLEFIASI